MKYIQRIKINLKLLARTIVAVGSAIFTLASFALMFIDLADLHIDTSGKKILAFLCLVVLTFIISVIRVFTQNSKDVFKADSYGFSIEYGDIWDYAFPSNDTSDRIVAIAVNTAFDTIVDPPDVNKPLVSVNTNHGRLIKKLEERNISPDSLNTDIQGYLNNQGIEYRQISKERGNEKIYPIGTVAEYRKDNTLFYLVALSEFDENNNASSDKSALIKAMKSLLFHYDSHGQGTPMYITLMGTGKSRTGLPPEEALEVMVDTAKLYKEKVTGKVNLIVYSKDKSNLSIDV